MYYVSLFLVSEMKRLHPSQHTDHEHLNPGINEEYLGSKPRKCTEYEQTREVLPDAVDLRQVYSASLSLCVHCNQTDPDKL